MGPWSVGEGNNQFITSIYYRGRFNSVGRAFDFRAGGRGFDSRAGPIMNSADFLVSSQNNLGSR